MTDRAEAERVARTLCTRTHHADGTITDLNTIGKTKACFQCRRNTDAILAYSKARDDEWRKHWEESQRQVAEAREAAGSANAVGPWMWQDDGGNFIESLGNEMAVSITGGQLRQLLEHERAELRGTLHDATTKIVSEVRERSAVAVQERKHDLGCALAKMESSDDPAWDAETLGAYRFAVRELQMLENVFRTPEQPEGGE